jgi:hypothetical protein
VTSLKMLQAMFPGVPFKEDRSAYLKPMRYVATQPLPPVRWRSIGTPAEQESDGQSDESLTAARKP